MYLNNTRLLVSDFRGCFRFYRDIMGFPVTWGEDTDDEGYASFRVGEGVTLALFKKQVMSDAIGTAHLPSKTASQDRLALVFEVAGRAEFDEAVERLRGLGVAFLAEPEDHADWGIRTVYFRDPDGTLIELETALKIDEVTPELRAEFDKYAVAE